MRKAFCQALTDQAKINSKIYLITGDLGYRVLEPFADQFPDRFINIGVAESSMVSFSAGMSQIGFIPFIYSIASFMTMRPYEQIRNDICLQNLNVKIIGIGAGLAYDKAGPTHYALEDIALMRMCPNMIIINPSNFDEVYEATIKAANIFGPVYIRIEHNPLYDIKDTKHKFILGKANIIKNGNQIALLTTGTKIGFALEINKLLKKENIDAAIISFPTINPIDKKMINNLIGKYRLLASIEEHSVKGGLGEEISEYLERITDKFKYTKLIRFGISDIIPGISANYEHLLEYYHFTPDHISQQIIEMKKLLK